MEQRLLMKGKRTGKAKKNNRKTPTWTFQPEPDVEAVIGMLLEKSNAATRTKFLNSGIRGGLLGDARSIIRNIEDRIHDLRLLQKAISENYPRGALYRMIMAKASASGRRRKRAAV